MERSVIGIPKQVVNVASWYRKPSFFSIAFCDVFVLYVLQHVRRRQCVRVVETDIGKNSR